MTRILVTAFGPFPGQPINPTPAIADAIAAGPLAQRHDVELVVRVLTTTWEALDGVPAMIAEAAPDLAIHLGLAGRARTVRLEMRGINVNELARVDAAGQPPPAVEIEAGGPRTRRCTVPLAEMAAAMRATGLAVSLSRSAGDYLCNALLYQSLGLAPEGRLVGFVHVPPTADMRPARPGARSAPTVEAIAGGVTAAIEAVLPARMLSAA